MSYVMRFFFALAVCSTLLLPALSPQHHVCAQDDASTVKLIFAGDLMGHIQQHHAAIQKDGSYDYTPCFRYVSDYIASADIAIVNLEVTLAGKPYTGYPCFSAPDAVARDARDAGFDIFTTANNHCMDKGRRGLERTIEILDSLHIAHLGTYADEESRMRNHPMIIDRNGIRIALLCYTYGTNGITVRHPNVVNLIDTNLMRRDLQEARRRGADYTITLIHWGIEYVTHANAEQQRIAQWLLSNGCNAVIGGHPHVVQNLTADAIPDNNAFPEIVVYSMGNLVSNMHSVNRDGGIMVELELTKKHGVTSVTDFAYMPYWVHIGNVDGKYQFHIVPSTDAILHPESYQISHAALPRLQRFHQNIHKLIDGCQPSGLRYPSAALGQIVERFFYNDRSTPEAQLFTYHYLNYDNLFPGCPDTEPISVYCDNDGISIRRTKHTGLPLLDRYDCVDLRAGCVLETSNPTSTVADYDNNGIIRWDTIPSAEGITIFRTVIDGNTIEAHIQQGGREVTPSPALRRLPGTVTAIYINGRAAIRLVGFDNTTRRTAVPFRHQ